MGHVSPNIDQKNYQFRDDDGSESAATFIGTLGSDETLDPDTNYRLRFIVAEDNNAASNNFLGTLEYSHNSGTWTPVTTTSTHVQAYDSTNLTNAADTTQQIGSGSFLGTNAGVSEDGTASGTVDFAGNDETEFEYTIKVIGTQVSTNDTIDFRISEADTATGGNPRLTVAAGATTLTHSQGAAETTSGTHVANVSLPHSQGAAETTFGTHTVTLSTTLTHTAGASTFSPGSHSVDVALGHSNLASTLSPGSHLVDPSLVHNQGAAETTSGTHTVSTATTLTHSQGVAETTSGTHTITAGLSHTAGASTFSPGTHSVETATQLTHTQGTPETTFGSHLVDVALDHAAGASTFSPGTHSVSTATQLDHTAGAAETTSGTHTISTDLVHNQGTAETTFGTHTISIATQLTHTQGTPETTFGSHLVDPGLLHLAAAASTAFGILTLAVSLPHTAGAAETTSGTHTISTATQLGHTAGAAETTFGSHLVDVALDHAAGASTFSPGTHSVTSGTIVEHSQGTPETSFGLHLVDPTLVLSAGAAETTFGSHSVSTATELGHTIGSPETSFGALSVDVALPHTALASTFSPGTHSVIADFTLTHSQGTPETSFGSHSIASSIDVGLTHKAADPFADMGAHNIWAMIMARKTQAELLSAISDRLASNQTGQISAATMREILADMVDTSFAEVGDVSVVPQAGVPWAEDISDGFATLAAAVAAHTGEFVHWLIDEAWTVSADLTIPPEVTLLFTPSGKITVELGNTLTISGQVYADPGRQIFVAAGAAYGLVRFNDLAPVQVYPQWFGAVADNTVDCADAIIAAVECRTGGVGGTTEGAEVVFAPGKYYCSKTLHLERRCKLVGTSSAFGGGGATLTFAPNTTGIIVWHASGAPNGGDAQWCSISHLALSPKVANQYWGAYGGVYGGDDSWKASAPNQTGHGIILAGRASISDCYIIGFGENGIYVTSSKYGTNTNNFLIVRTRCGNCGGAGLLTEGADANAGVTILAEASTCRFGLYEGSFLGNLHVGFMEELSQMAPVIVDGAANYSTLIACYVEGDPPASYPEFEGRSMVIGGSLSIWAPLGDKPCGIVLSHYGYNRGVGNGYFRHTSGMFARGTQPGWIDGNLAISDEIDGATYAQMSVDVTAGPSGVTIGQWTSFTHDPADEYPFSPDAGAAGQGRTIGPQFAYFYAIEATVIAPNATETITLQAGYPGVYYNVDAGFIDRPVVENPDIVSVIQAAPATGGAKGTTHYSLKYWPHPEGYPTEPQRFGGSWYRGKFVLNTGNTLPIPLMWSGKDDLYFEPAQLGAGVAMMDCPAFVTQLQETTLATGAETTFEFNGAPQWGVNFLSGLTEDEAVFAVDLDTDVDDVVIRRQWLDTTAGKFKVKVRNDNAGSATVKCKVLMWRRAKYKA